MCKHKWEKGTIIFEGRVNLITGKTDIAYQCEKCGIIKYEKK